MHFVDLPFHTPYTAQSNDNARRKPSIMVIMVLPRERGAKKPLQTHENTKAQALWSNHQNRIPLSISTLRVLLRKRPSLSTLDKRVATFFTNPLFMMP